MKYALIGGLALALAGSCAAFAQDAPTAPPPKPDVKTVEDWQVRCYPIQSISPCDIFQEQGDPRSGQRVLSLSLAFVPSMNRHIIQLTVPLDVAIPNGVVMQTDSYTSPVLKYRMCTRDGCFVQTAVDDSLIEGLAKGSTGKVNVVGDNGKKYALNFSLKGFVVAHDDMTNQAKAKATKAAPPAPH